MKQLKLRPEEIRLIIVTGLALYPSAVELFYIHTIFPP